MTHYLDTAFPGVGSRLGKVPIATLPTPVAPVRVSGSTVWIKRDDVSSPVYGGNKIRKLEYILHRALTKNATRVATFGAAASNHALATAIVCRELGLDCTCFLAHQTKSDKVARALRAHVRLGTEVVYLGGDYRRRLETLRRFAQHRNCWIVPLGGSSWLGTVGFVNAAFELAEQVARGDLPCPDLLYVATGTMGTTAGLALGLALADLPTRIQAVRVTDDRFANPAALQRLIGKTACMLREAGAGIPEDILAQTNIEHRDEFFAGGYAKFDDSTVAAVDIARRDAGLHLETTYTGKAMAALLSDLRSRDLRDQNILFWNTYNSRPLADAGDADLSGLPKEFDSYFRP